MFEEKAASRPLFSLVPAVQLFDETFYACGLDKQIFISRLDSNLRYRPSVDAIVVKS